MRIVALMLLALTLAGCEHFKSSVAGSCVVFERPPYVVRGKTRYDQDVADKFVESGVAGCNWARPAPRPRELDAAAARQPLPAKPVKRSLAKRIRDRLAPAPAEAAPMLPAAPPVIATPEVATPAPAPKPRSIIDELLYPAR